MNLTMAGIKLEFYLNKAEIGWPGLVGMDRTWLELVGMERAGKDWHRIGGNELDLAGIGWNGEGWQGLAQDWWE